MTGPPEDAAEARTDAPTDAVLLAQSVRSPERFAAVFDRHSDEIHRYVARRLLRGEVFVDPKTYAYLGFRFTVVRDHTGGAGELPVRKGQIMGWGSLLAASAVSGPGSRS